MQNDSFTVTVRSRGQITVPDSVRKRNKWLKEGYPVTLIHGDDVIEITPLRVKDGQDINWRKLWQQITLVRSFKGKKGNLTSFIVNDRERHP